jgi:hypothetical protein
MSGERPSTGSYIGRGLGGVVFIYFGFPALWFWPIWKVYGFDPPPWLHPLAIPVDWLALRFPIYLQWVQWGFELLGIK